MPRGRPLAPLTERDMETLGELIACQDSTRRRYGSHPSYADRDADNVGYAPIEFGGRNGSHHGVTASKLAHRGFAEECKRGFGWGKAPKSFRGSKIYRPTLAGRQVFKEWQAARKAGEPIQVFAALVLPDSLPSYVERAEQEEGK